MDELHRLEARGLARARARSRRRRASIIRSRTVRGSLGLFAILWAIIFLQLVTGNDPALSHNHEVAKAAQETRADGSREPETAAAAAPPDLEPESAIEAERQLEAELAAKREAEWEAEPVVPVITSAS